MCHITKIMHVGSSFRMNVADTKPYNADFDGDEMSLHIPQSAESRAEALMLMMVHNQIVSPRYGGPIIGGTRDYITAGYLLTHEDTFLEEDYQHLLNQTLIYIQENNCSHYFYLKTSTIN